MSHAHESHNVIVALPDGPSRADLLSKGLRGLPSQSAEEVHDSQTDGDDALHTFARHAKPQQWQSRFCRVSK